MKRWFVLVIGLLVMAAVVVPALAQTQQPSDPAQAPGFGRGGRALGVGLLVCSTSNPTDTVAQALGMSASDLRVALVSGQTISQIAASKNVDLQTIQDALASQRQADLDQALKDGLLTQAQHDALSQTMKNVPQATGRLQLRIPDHNVANPEAAAAEALGVSCADLVKAERNGQSIAQIAGDKGVEVQAVIDAVMNAYKDALAQDVKEGLISQAEADGQASRLASGISLWVNGARGRGQGGFGFGAPNGFNRPFGFGRLPFGQRGGQNGFGFGRPQTGITPPNGFNGPQGGFGFGRPPFGNRGGPGNRGQGSQPTTPMTPEATPTTPHV
jgi:hypothetical protein